MEQKDFYHTIQSPVETDINIKRSKFLAYAYPISSADEALQIVEQLRKEHYSATHVCWAYALDAAYEEHRVNDDGEPSGTAGKPILGRIVSAGLTAVLVAVVRYFGGVKLGTGGLIDAYKEAAAEVLALAEVKEVVEMCQVELAFDAALTGEVMYRAKKHNAEVVAQDYTDCYHLTVELRRGALDGFLQDVCSVYGVRHVTDEE